jgi:hypothetical protein
MKLILKLAIGVAVAGGLAYLFVRTASDTRSEPYQVQQHQLRGWTLSLETSGGASSPLLVLRPPQELGGDLFRQVFSRMMESMKGSAAADVPIVLRQEYEMSLASVYTPAELFDAARLAGLESAVFAPRCVAVRRISEPGLTRQLYFVLFDAPAFVQFREELRRGLGNSPSSVMFDPAGLSPVLIVGASDAAFDRWLPLRASADADCVASISVN